MDTKKVKFVVSLKNVKGLGTSNPFLPSYAVEKKSKKTKFTTELKITKM